MPTTGEEFLVPDGSATPFRRASHVKVTVGAAAYVGFGTAADPPAVSAANSVYHASGTEMYAIPELSLHEAEEANDLYLYVYSVAATLVADVSWFA